MNQFRFKDIAFFTVPRSTGSFLWGLLLKRELGPQEDGKSDHGRETG